MNTCCRTVLLLLTPLVVLATPDPGSWRPAQPGYPWSFPADLASHPDYKTEWWYITGHLQPQDAPDDEPLGFQLTFFRVGIQPPSDRQDRTAWEPGDLIMAHAALTDPEAKEHVFSEVIRRATPFLGGFGSPGDSTLAWCVAPAGTDGRWRLSHDGRSFHLTVRDKARDLAFDLRCTPRREPVFHGEGGFSPKSADGSVGSLYFSQPRMQTEGTVRRGGKTRVVTGDSWLDREIFTSTLAPGQKGWDWFALNLTDGRDLMLYRLRDAAGGEDFALGTLVKSDGGTETLSGVDWEAEPESWWTSPETGSRYPVRWRITVPGQELSLLLEATIPDQENVSKRSGVHYWEGAVVVKDGGGSGRRLGRGFVELTGYGKGSRPPL